MDNLRELIESNGTVKPDQRGKRGTHNAIDPKLVDGVNEHIQTLFVCDSHYNIKNKLASKQYLIYNEKYNALNKLYKRYKEFCDTKDYQAVKEYYNK